MKNTITVIYLAIAGLLLLAIGSAILLAPHTFHGSNDIMLGDNPNLLSEVRAPGGLLAVSGFVVLLGARRVRLHASAVQLATLVYGSFGLARLVSMALDGMPSSSIVGATSLELIVALVGLVILRLPRGEYTKSMRGGPRRSMNKTRARSEPEDKEEEMYLAKRTPSLEG